VKRNIHSKNDVSCTISIGASDTETVGYDIQRLFTAADNAMYMAKNRGRNLVATQAGIATRMYHASEEFS